MRRLSLLFAATAVLATAQDLSPGPAPKLDDYAARALQNALRPPAGKQQNPSPGFKLWKDQASPTVTLPESFQSAGNTCAIPLRTVPVNSSIDPRVQHKLDPRDVRADNMPRAKAMPVCRQ